MFIEAEFILDEKCDQNTNCKTYGKPYNINNGVDSVFYENTLCDLEVGLEHRYRFDSFFLNDNRYPTQLA
jgi:hypothetical protein